MELCREFVFMWHEYFIYLFTHHCYWVLLYTIIQSKLQSILLQVITEQGGLSVQPPIAPSIQTLLSKELLLDHRGPRGSVDPSRLSPVLSQIKLFFGLTVRLLLTMLTRGQWWTARTQSTCRTLAHPGTRKGHENMWTALKLEIKPAPPPQPLQLKGHPNTTAQKYTEGPSNY